MPETSKSRYQRFKLITAFLSVGIISLLQPGCDCSSSNSGGTAPPSAITAVSPLSNSVTTLVTTDVSAVFLDEMEGETVINAFTLTLNNTPVPATVTYDVTTKTTVLTPLTDLMSNTEYRATIASSVKDINGNSPLSADYIWSFKTSPSMQLVSKNTSGVTSNDLSWNSDIDSTGRYIVFESEASNLTSVATTLNRQHIYRKDTVTGETILVSSDASGLVEANTQASNPSISANGRYVVFNSTATNLDAAINSNGISQVYLKDMDDGSIDLVSRSATLAPDNSLAGASFAKVSDDGLRIVFQSPDKNLSLIDGGGVSQIYLKNMSDESVQMISRSATNVAGNNTSSNPDMSADGKYIVFESSASNLTTSNSFNHIYFVDTSAATHAVEQISMTSAGAEATANCNRPSVSDDGSMVVFDTVAILDSFDNNGTTDVYFRYRPLVFTKLVSANPGTNDSGNGASSNASISGDANYVAFESLASDLATEGALGVKDIFVRNLSALPVTVIDRVNNHESGGEATSDSISPAISKDGRYVSFHSIAPFTLDDTDTLFDVFRAHNSTQP
jgi:hypothetical protein